MPVVLQDYKGRALLGGAGHRRFLNSSRLLAGGGAAGALSRHGWRQTVELGARLRARYLGRPGPGSLLREPGTDTAADPSQRPGPNPPV